MKHSLKALNQEVDLHGPVVQCHTTFIWSWVKFPGDSWNVF